MVKQERFFNKYGGLISNIQLDLVVEREYRLVHERLALYCGEFDDYYLELISKSHENVPINTNRTYPASQSAWSTLSKTREGDIWPLFRGKLLQGVSRH